MGKLIQIKCKGTNSIDINQSIIYKATNLINGKMYVGKTIKKLRERKSAHKHEASNCNDNRYFHKAIRKYGFENFKWEVIDYALSEEISFNMEKYYIKKLKTKAPIGYNLTDGGEGVSGYENKLKTGRYKRCVICGKEFWAIPFHEKNKQGKYCSRECSIFAQKKEYTFINPKGEKIVCLGLNNFCKENNLNAGCIDKVLHGKANHHKEWRMGCVS